VAKVPNPSTWSTPRPIFSPSSNTTSGSTPTTNTPVWTPSATTTAATYPVYTLYTDKRPWPEPRCGKDLTDALGVTVAIDGNPFPSGARVVDVHDGVLELPPLEPGIHTIQYEIHWRGGSVTALHPFSVEVVASDPTADDMRSPLRVCQACGEEPVERGKRWCPSCAKAAL
jgi:hypothetical protein